MCQHCSQKAPSKISDIDYWRTVWKVFEAFFLADLEKPWKTDQGHCGGNLGEGAWARFFFHTVSFPEIFVPKTNKPWSLGGIHTLNSQKQTNRIWDNEKDISTRISDFQQIPERKICVIFSSHQCGCTCVGDSTIICTDGPPAIQKPDLDMWLFSFSATFLLFKFSCIFRPDLTWRHWQMPALN